MDNRGAVNQLNVLANDSVDGTLEIVVQPEHGAVDNLGNGELRYKLTDKSFKEGVDTFVYRVTDVYGRVADANVTVVVSTTYEPDLLPVSPEIYELDANKDVTWLIPHFGGETVYISKPYNGYLQQNRDGSLSYYPEYDFEGTDAFYYTVIDGAGWFNVVPVLIQVGEIDVAPSVVLDEANVSINKPTDLFVLQNDLPSTLEIKVVSWAGNGQVDFNTEWLTYDPVSQYVGLDTFVYIVQDMATGNIGIGRVIVNVAKSK